MADGKVEFEGATQFASDMERLEHELETALTDALVTVARGLIPRVQSVMPTVSGALAGSVEVETPKPLEADVIARTDYAGWIEFGGGTHERPFIATGRFLVPTVMNSEPVVDTTLSTEASKMIGGFPWSHTSR